MKLVKMSIFDTVTLLKIPDIFTDYVMLNLQNTLGFVIFYRMICKITFLHNMFCVKYFYYRTCSVKICIHFVVFGEFSVFFTYKLISNPSHIFT